LRLGILNLSFGIGTLPFKGILTSFGNKKEPLKGQWNDVGMTFK